MTDDAPALPPVIAVVGRSGSGKTTLIEKILATLVGRGLTVGTVKHQGSGHGVDVPGKDSDRHIRAGACRVALVAADRTALFEPSSGEGLADVMARHFTGLDAIVVEGFKRAPFPKIEVRRAALSRDPVCQGDPNLVAIAADFPVAADVPVFDLDDIAGLTGIVSEVIMAPKKTSAWQMELTLDGKRVPAKAFVRDAIAGALTGLIGTLKGVPEDYATLSLSMKRNEAPETTSGNGGDDA